MDEIRDPEIGRLLSGGSVAEHEAGYWDALREAVAPELEALEPETLAARPRRRRLLRMGLAAAAVAAAAVVAFAVLPALRGTDAATAADMLASMSRASSDVPDRAAAHRAGVLGSLASLPSAGIPQPTTIAGQVALIKRKTIADLILSTNGDFRASQAHGEPRWPGRHSRLPPGPVWL